jgi:diguanylate cyclase (GGDEF)-like protein
MHNYTVDSAANGADALDKASKNNYDLILLDVMMPKLSGYDVCKTLRETKATYELPVILLTAKNRPEDIVTGFDTGANDYIVKPFEKRELLARTGTLVSLKKAIENVVIQERLANADGLTGLNNRRHLFELGTREFELTRRHKRSFSVMMMDIDHFKKFNDTYGHDIGDKILKLVASAIKEAARTTDIIGRYGGEEFTVLLPEAELDGAKIVAERIRENVAAKRLKTEEYGELSCTISIGVAMLGSDEKDIEELIKKADAKLYEAKESGRNRVVG